MNRHEAEAATARRAADRGGVRPRIPIWLLSTRRLPSSTPHGRLLCRTSTRSSRPRALSRVHFQADCDWWNSSGRSLRREASKDAGLRGAKASACPALDAGILRNVRKTPLRRLGGARLRREPPKRARLKPCIGADLWRRSLFGPQPAGARLRASAAGGCGPWALAEPNFRSLSNFCRELKPCTGAGSTIFFCRRYLLGAKASAAGSGIRFLI